MTKVVSNYGLALRLRNGAKLLPRLLLYNPCIAQNPGMVSSVGERDIYTGDSGEIFLIDAAGISKTEFDLKLD